MEELKAGKGFSLRPLDMSVLEDKSDIILSLDKFLTVLDVYLTWT